MKKSGIIVTVIYGLGLATWVYLDWHQFCMLAPNEWGDFLAGTVGPVALLWVVLSFWLQSDELKNSVEALNLQARELQKSVEQQAEMVSVTRDSLEHERSNAAKAHASRQKALEPDLVITYAATVRHGKAVFQFKLRINNVGAQVSRFEFILFDGAETHLQLSQTLFTNGKTVEKDGFRGELPPERLSATAQFTNSDGIPNVWQYEFLRTSKSNGWPEYKIVRKMNNPSA